MDSHRQATERILELLSQESMSPLMLRHAVVFNCFTGEERVSPYAYIGAYWILINQEKIDVDEEGRVHLVQSPSNG